MKKIFGKLCMGGVFLFCLSMSLTSCEDVLGHWEKPTPIPITPTVEEVIKYGFKVTDLAGVDRTEAVTSLKMSNDDGPVATAEVSGGKITIKADDLSGITTAIEFWFEAEIGGKPYIAKVTIDPTTLSPEIDKTLEMATLGDVILADGTFAASSSTGTKVAKIAYLGNDAETNTDYTHGLALALSDANGGSVCEWSTSNTKVHTYNPSDNSFASESGLQYNDATHNSGTYPAFKAAIANNGTAAPTGCSSWFLASGYQWQKMATAAGSYANLKTNAGLKDLASYWSSTESDASHAWLFDYNVVGWLYDNKDNKYLVRACLAF